MALIFFAVTLLIFFVSAALWHGLFLLQHCSMFLFGCRGIVTFVFVAAALFYFLLVLMAWSFFCCSSLRCGPFFWLPQHGSFFLFHSHGMQTFVFVAVAPWHGLFLMPWCCSICCMLLQNSSLSWRSVAACFCCCRSIIYDLFFCGVMVWFFWLLQHCSMVCFAVALWHGLFFVATELQHGLFLLSWLVFSLFNAADLWHGLCCVAAMFVFWLWHVFCYCSIAPLFCFLFFAALCYGIAVFCCSIVCCF